MPFPARLSFEDAVRDGGAALRGALARHGYAHVTGVVGRAECAAWCDDLRRFIAALGFPGARFDDPASVADPARWPEGCAEGIFGGYGVGHTEAAWRGRTHPRVHALQAAYWGTDALVSSLDGANAELPRLAPRRRADAAAISLHLDVNPCCTAPLQRQEDAIQGVLLLTRTSADGGGTTVVAGSHAPGVAGALFPRGHPLRARGAAEKWHNFYRLSRDEVGRLLALPGCALMHLETAPGDVVLFSSLAVHCGRRARAPARDATAWRFALYATCIPAGRLTAGDRARKRVALGLAPDPRTGLRRAETTNHPPEGGSFKSWAGDAAAGVTAPPAWVLRDDAALRLAGAIEYPAHGGAAPAAPASPATVRLGGAKRVLEADVDGRRASRLARFDAPPTAKPAAAAVAADEIIVIDD